MNQSRVHAGVPAGGQFAALARDVAAGVALGAPADPRRHESLTRALGVDNHRRHHGYFENVTEDSLTFVEQTVGDTETRYDVRFDSAAITVRDEYTNASHESYLFRVDDEVRDDEIVKAINGCRAARRDIVAANEVFANLTTGTVSRELDAGVATVDLGDGRLPVVLGPYSSVDDGFDEPHLRVNVGGTPYRLAPSDGYHRLPVVTRDDLEDVDEDEAATVLARVGSALGGEATSTRHLVDALRIARSKHP